MYQVLLGDINGNNSILYYPGDEKCVIYDTKLSLSVGTSGTFEFKMPLNNPLYSAIMQGSIITILRDGIELWRGEVIETSKDFSGNLSVYCVEDLSWLSVEYMKPTSIINESYAQRFQSAIESYNNNQSGTERQFKIGYITNVLESDTCNWETQYEWSILESIRECIAKDTGYLRVRRSNENGHTERYIDCVRLSDFGTASQTIRFAENMLDYVEDMDMGNFTNVIYPYGAELEDELYEGTNARLEGTVLEDAQSIATYGRHARNVIFDTDDLTTLNSLAQSYLNRYSQPQLRFELTALDLADISVDTHFDIGNKIRVIADPFGIDQWVFLVEQTIDLQDLSKNTITLSSYVEIGRSLTDQTVNTSEMVKDLPSKNSMLEAAKKNATELINGNGTNGHVVLHEKDGVIYEILIMDTTDIDTATKMWRWNEAGFGYREKKDGEWKNYKAAITMDGEIVADFITSGVLNSIEINGVTINGSSINGSTFNQNTDTGHLSIHDGWIYGNSGKDAGSAMLLNGSGSETLYGSRYMHALMNGSFIETETLNICRAGAEHSSDKRLKDNIKLLDYEESKSIIDNTNSYSFEYKKSKGKTHFGVIAQELLEAIKNEGYTDEEIDTVYKIDDMYGVAYVELIPHLMNYVKDLQEQINNLKKG